MFAPASGVEANYDVQAGGLKRGREENDVNAEKKLRPDDDNGHVVLKVLASDNECGKVIGKQGAVIKQTMQDSGTTIRVSAPDEVVPGTGERIVTIMGPLHNVVHAAQLVQSQLIQARGPVNPGEEREADSIVKFLVPDRSTGTIIGKAGSVIKEIMDGTGAKITVSQPAQVLQATSERTITVQGPPANRDAAIEAIYLKFLAISAEYRPKETSYSALRGGPGRLAGAASSPYGAPAGGYGYNPAAQFPWLLEAAQSGFLPPNPYSSAFGYAAAAAGAPRPGSRGGAASKSEMSLPEKVVAGIIGRGGEVVKAISARSGCRVRFSQKSEITADGMRLVIFEGAADTVAVARRLVEERIKEIEGEMSSGSIPRAGSETAAGSYTAVPPSYGSLYDPYGVLAAYGQYQAYQQSYGSGDHQ
jgi:predicted RNA-binding protein YlqC (UPF0109 family)